MKNTLFRNPDRTREDGAAYREPQRIAVFGAGSCVGTSFVSGLIAGAMRERGRVCLAELSSPYFYTALGMDRRFAARRFEFYADVLGEKRSLRQLEDTECGINWALLDPKRELRPDAAGTFRTIYNLPGDILIFDCGSADLPLCADIAAECDRSFFVIDPLPSRLLAYYRLIEDIRLDRPDTVFVVNKMNPGVHVSSLSSFLGTRKYQAIPCIGPELIYGAEYGCCLPYDVPQIREAVRGFCDAL